MGIFYVVHVDELVQFESPLTDPDRGVLARARKKAKLQTRPFLVRDWR